MDPALVERMLSLPLFQGMNPNNLEALLKGHRTDITQRRGKIIVEEYELLTHLVVVVDGKVLASAKGPGFRLDEMVATPTVLQPECLMGRQTRYTHRFASYTQTHLLRIRKDYIVNHFMQNEVFRLNMFNLLCTAAQHREHLLWLNSGGTLEQRFAQFLIKRSMTPEGTKILHCRMTSLAEALSTTRLRVSQMLAAQQTQNRLESRRGLIIIPSFERFIAP